MSKDAQKNPPLHPISVGPARAPHHNLFMVVRRKLRTGKGDSSRRAHGRRRAVALEPLAQEYLRERRLAGMSVATLNQDRWGLARIAAVTDTLPIDRAAALAIFDVGLKPTSLGQLVSVVKRIFRWVEEIHGIPSPIKGFRPKTGRRSMPRVLTEMEIEALLAVARKPLLLALVMLILDTGLRIGEVESLTKQSIKRFAGRIVLEVEGKTGERGVPMSPYVADMIEALGDDVLIWKSRTGRALKADALQKRIRRLMKKAGMSGPRLGPHSLRHTYATAFIVNGGDVAFLKDLLGHDSIETTEKYVTLAAVHLHAAHGRYGLSAVMGWGEDKLLRPPTPAHVTVSGGVITHVSDAWICDVPDPATMDS